MKKILSNNLTLIGEIITIILATVWFLQNKEIEPLILLILAIIALFTSIFLKRNSPKIVMTLEYSSNGRMQKGPSRSDRNPRDEDGSIILYAGGGISVYYWDLRIFYTLKIRNNSSYVAYQPILYTQNLTHKIIFSNFFDEFNPIQPQEKLEIDIKYIFRFEGTANEADEKLKNLGKFPIDIKNLIILLSYADDSDNKYYSILSLVDNTTERKRKLPKDFSKLKLHPIQKLRK